MSKLPVSYSVSCTSALLRDVIPKFQIENAVRCLFWCQGINDSYKVITSSNTYLLRIYRYGWRALSDIQFELDALLHLQKCGVDIAYPIATRQGKYIVTIDAPEGSRYAILTTYIAGNELNFSKTDNVSLYAEHMAKIHLHTTQFSSEHTRDKLDSNHLIHSPVQRIAPFLVHRQDDWEFIQRYAQKLSEKLQKAFNSSQDIGFCHGDFHGGNAHIDGGHVASFDFDCCGIGLRVYDLAVFKWSLALSNKSPDIWKHFLLSYQSHRPITPEDLALIDTLISIRHIWLIGLHIENSVAQGWLNEKYFDRKIAFLREEQQRCQAKHSL